MATVSIVMKYGSVKGESGLSDYPEWIVLNDIYHSGGWSQSSAKGTDTDLAQSTLEMSQISINRNWDTSSFALLQEFAKGKPQSTVTIKAVAGKGGEHVIASYELENVAITGWNMQHGDGVGGEHIELTASKMSVTGYGYDDKGNQNKNIPVKYDYTKAAPV
ncbi:MAG: type VI secretion system tube protein Hcp [Gluconacetobacter diazotrophicus]|nr:type VI secretion system tube protein Hcp [Gluconacetobacter diazotrophicus]